MRKFLIMAIPIATLALFICIMLSGTYLKKSMSKDDDIPGLIEELTQTINNEAWDKANSEIDDLDRAWKKVIKRIQFSSERDEINFLDTNIARLRGAVLAEDKANSLIELKEAYQHWEDIGK